MLGSFEAELESGDRLTSDCNLKRDENFGIVSKYLLVKQPEEANDTETIRLLMKMMKIMKTHIMTTRYKGKSNIVKNTKNAFLEWYT